MEKNEQEIEEILKKMELKEAVLKEEIEKDFEMASCQLKNRKKELIQEVSTFYQGNKVSSEIICLALY